MMSPVVSVIVPAHNPRADHIGSTLAALRLQSVPVSEWELVVIDNKSDEPLASRLDVSWHPNARVILEPALGLARALVAGFRAAKGELILTVADDNVLAQDYIEQALKISTQHPFLGSWSGNIELVLEDPANPPPDRLRHLLCERAVSGPIWSNDRHHIAATPWGAGMCIRRVVVEAYIEATQKNPRRLKLDLQGKNLAYGGDTDIAYTGCAMGLGMGVIPQLKFKHLIPKGRCTLEYLLRNLEAHAYSEILHEWVLTGQVAPARSDLRGRIGAAVRWLGTDALGRKMLTARRQGYNRARRELAEQA